MILSRNKLKRVPLPCAFFVRSEGEECKIWSVIQRKFASMYGFCLPLSNRKKVEWAEFLVSRGIYWDVVSKQRPDWDGWESCESSQGATKVWSSRPKDTGEYIKTLKYYVPRDLAMKILVFGELL